MSLAKTFDIKAFLTGLAGASLVVIAILIGSRGLAHFDPALVWYATGSVLAVFAVGYRFMVWAQRPPSRMYFRRGIELMLRRGKFGRALGKNHPSPLIPLPVEGRGRSQDASGNSSIDGSNPAQCGSNSIATAGKAFGQNFVAQKFIKQRSTYRWIMHLCLSGGCTLAFAITFPLVFGWVHFEPLAGNAEIYRVKVFGFGVDQFNVHSAKAFVMFNLLNFSAIIVLVGLVMAAIRRITDAGERAVQSFAEDILPLLLIFAVTATGLMLTVSYKFMAGRGHAPVAIAHMISVIALLFYIPFGRLFHMFQRACSLCVSVYKKAGAEGARAHCIRCGGDYASQMHVDDLKTVLDELGFNYRFATAEGEVHYQDVCPTCRRRLLALNQGRTVGR